MLANVKVWMFLQKDQKREKYDRDYVSELMVYDDDD